LPKALERMETVQKAAWARPGKRPTYDDHLRTITYVGPTLNKEAAVVMFDDVITMKNTSSACREILRSSQGIESAKGIYLARTM
jgi:predicted amidophosphoribosyltransferase